MNPNDNWQNNGQGGGQFPPQPQQPVQPQQQSPQAVFSQPNNSLGSASRPTSTPLQGQNYVHVEPPKTWVFVGIGAIVLAVIFAGLAVWAFLNYKDQKDNVDQRISSETSAALREQAERHAGDIERVKNDPYSEWTGPEDYGSLSVKYPRDWSVYVHKDAVKGGDYEAMLNPGYVGFPSNTSINALNFFVIDSDYDTVVSKYLPKVRSGDLKSTSIRLNGDVNGTRLEGNFTNDLRGAAVIFKIRDKTAFLRTDAEVFIEYFNEIVESINFVK